MELQNVQLGVNELVAFAHFLGCHNVRLGLGFAQEEEFQGFGGGEGGPVPRGDGVPHGGGHLLITDEDVFVRLKRVGSLVGVGFRPVENLLSDVPRHPEGSRADACRAGDVGAVNPVLFAVRFERDSPEGPLARPFDPPKEFTVPLTDITHALVMAPFDCSVFEGIIITRIGHLVPIAPRHAGGDDLPAVLADRLPRDPVRREGGFAILVDDLPEAIDLFERVFNEGVELSGAVHFVHIKDLDLHAEVVPEGVDE